MLCVAQGSIYVPLAGEARRCENESGFDVRFDVLELDPGSLLEPAV